MATLPQEEDVLSESAEAAADGRRSTIGLLRNVVIDLTRIVEDSTELIGASVREELAHFREDIARHALSVVAMIIGGSLASAGLAMLVSDWLDNWPVTLLLFGVLYLALAFLLRFARPRGEDGSP